MSQLSRSSDMSGKPVFGLNKVKFSGKECRLHQVCFRGGGAASLGIGREPISFRHGTFSTDVCHWPTS
jgi:hypothetical protein